MGCISRIPHGVTAENVATKFQVTRKDKINCKSQKKLCKHKKIINLEMK